MAQLQAGNVQQAKAEMREATTIAPNFTEAVLGLAELNLQTDVLQPAIDDLEQLVRRQPRILQAYALLGSAYLAKQESVRATEAFRKLATLAPGDPRGPYLVGIGLRAQAKPAEAKKELEAALTLAPGYAEPMAELISMAFAEKRPDLALSRVTKQITAEPKSGALRYLLGLVYLDRREAALAEGALLKAIELDPQLADAYVRLSNLYMSASRYDEALAKLGDALKVNPQALAAQMLAGIVHERKGDIAEAQRAYEKALALNPRFAPAANNLAVLYSEHGGDMEKALQLAQRAKEASPDDPRVSDTLGWILYKRGVYQRALALFKESATKLPGEPVIQYRLGLASMKVGDRDGARKALTAALNAPVGFAEQDEARRALAELK
jgi:tetratricopeptide (TPR) repeat protein